MLGVVVGDTVGLVLGHHRVGAYPYHTQIDLQPDRSQLAAVTAVDRMEVVARSDRVTTTDAWARVQLAQRGGRLALWVDGELVFSAPTSRDVVSLVGLYVHGGEARFKGLALAPAPGFAAGPAEAQPPAWHPGVATR